MNEIRSAFPEAMTKERLLIEMTTPQVNGTPVYLTGNFNGWKVGQEAFRMEQVEAGRYRYVFPRRDELPQTLEYKYVRGDWDGEELDAYGNTINNRSISKRVPCIGDYVPRWKNGGLSYPPDLLPVIEVISEHFEIPQLIKTRRIAALLPHDYYRTQKRYPVLYLQDGQNLFDDHAPFGSWGVDKKLAVMAERGLGGLIVIAIDHAEEERIREFTPSPHPHFGSGDGKKYARFLAETLKPYVDSHFRTRPGRQDTGLGGSSLGGLISIYGGLKFPEIYSRLMIFSPSLWVEPNIHFSAMHFGKAYDTKIYIYGGEAESANMVPNIKRFMSAVEEHDRDSRISFKLSIDPAGKHNEQRWGEEFPKAAEWLFFHEDRG